MDSLMSCRIEPQAFNRFCCWVQIVAQLNSFGHRSGLPLAVQWRMNNVSRPYQLAPTNKDTYNLSKKLLCVVKVAFPIQPLLGTNRCKVSKFSSLVRAKFLKDDMRMFSGRCFYDDLAPVSNRSRLYRGGCLCILPKWDDIHIAEFLMFGL